ncbi:MAG: phage Gp37/Gp68 family protein [Desulfovibrio sp.]|nr:phage Gp37/Gp68 family protein [Desulfovibrio sp.]
MHESEMWNLWHGCHRKSEGCRHCYVFRRDMQHGIDSEIIRKTAAYDLPLRRNRQGGYKVPPGTIMWTCFTSDFFIEEADEWRDDVWGMMRRRSDLNFVIATKRPERIKSCLPADWGEGYANVAVCCTMENQRRADERLPLMREAPLLHKSVICEPLLERITFRGKLDAWCEHVTVGGESGPAARMCDYDWVLDIRRQCVDAGVSFHFKQTGAVFRKDGLVYRIPRSEQSEQARCAGVNYHAE